MPKTLVTPAENPSEPRLLADLARLNAQALARRSALRWLMGAGVLPLLGCGGGGSATVATGSSPGGSISGSTGSSTGSCAVIPEETAGPYPGDGSNSSGGAIANALALSGIVRSDIRASIAGASAVADGVPLQVNLKLVNANGACADLAGYAIYLWHCDAQGRYSMYSSGVSAENYLRGVQATASDGTATFQTIFPGCYAGRVPHMHFEIYRSTNSASSFGNKLKTSQLAFPNEVCSAVYASGSAYSASVSNFAAVSLSSDGIFNDGVNQQLCTVTGSVSAGYVAQLQVGIAA
jgi:protocatechuate 3,4-dioxygenase beta subunit